MRTIDSQYYFCMFACGEAPMFVCHSFPPMLPRSLPSLFKSKLCDSAPCKNELSNLLIIFHVYFSPLQHGPFEDQL
jgi:hypothetical protein